MSALWRSAGAFVVLWAVAGVFGCAWWRWEHTGDPPRLTATQSYRLETLPQADIETSGHYNAASRDGLPARLPPLGPAYLAGSTASVSVAGQPVEVVFDDRGALCSGPSTARFCVAGPRRAGGRCDDCGAEWSGNAILATGADLVITSWTPPNIAQYVSMPHLVRIWRITIEGPKPLIQLGVPRRGQPFEAWVAPHGEGAELVVATGSASWQIVQCTIAGPCQRSTTLNTYPTIDSALSATYSDGSSTAGWPDRVALQLRACQVTWPASLETRGEVATTPPTTPSAAGAVHVTLTRPDIPEPAVIPLTLTANAEGPFSFVVENPPHPIVQPDLLQFLVNESTCQLHHTSPDGEIRALTAAIPLT